ncbi:hypothetical protein L228DRAFT_259842 [Xylona heveae TC161]|uniref:Ubiquitin-like domain-containing protein n=1 Tax=Xylona heveae (strain CBS 132557 / TC161) TaxID=1328760 RepID=A0A165IB76_XYLHT|nr:hypothetical protein L228DRAFT_259842 [Xylona heveae TC161]KZF24654.1 hypothetical protein L228DRAFT_259842 [Xylona heveae TC161]
MSGNPAGEDQPKTAPPKRSLFNKPSWAAPRNTGENVDFFRRANFAYNDIVAEEEEELKRKIAQRAKEQAAQDKANVASKDGKRRRISNQDEDNDENTTAGNEERAKHDTSAPSDKSISPITQDSRPLPESYDSSKEPLHTRSSNSVLGARESRPERASRNIISLDEDDDEPIRPINPPSIEDDDDDLAIVRPPPRQIEADQEQLSDEEFPELARKAREKERARLEQLERRSESQATPEPRSQSITRPASTQVESASPPAPDPVVQILITSPIPHTTPLIATRKLSQRLKDVRLAWCERQGFDPDTATLVFLTWREKRIFDVTTCKSLGFGLNNEGNVVLKGENNAFGGEFGRIHMEAVTEEIFKEQKKNKAAGYGDQANAEDELEEQFVPEQPAIETIKIVLKSKEFDELKLKVKPTTQMSRLINAFRHTNNIPQETGVHLVFDGDRLEPDMEVQETEISDMDYIDVFLK